VQLRGSLHPAAQPTFTTPSELCSAGSLNVLVVVGFELAVHVRERCAPDDFNACMPPRQSAGPLNVVVRGWSRKRDVLMSTRGRT